MWNLKIIDTDKALYLAVADALEQDIRNGSLHAGEKLPPQRSLAKKVGVNVTTITRAYKEAERRGLVSAVIGSGTFVSSDLGLNTSLLNTEKNTVNMIEMGLVYPLYSAEPDITPVIERVLHKNKTNELMKYATPQGLLRHRQTAAAWIGSQGVLVTPENIVITAGAQHALQCILLSVFLPGDHIAVDCLTYPGFKTAARLCNIKLEAVPMDEQGMTPKGLAAACKNHEIKGIYTVTSLHNPTNTVMSESRRNELAEIIQKNNLLLLEDDLYRAYAPAAPAPLSALLPENSIYIAGLSKLFYAGLRISFVAAPARLCNRISQAVVDTLQSCSPLNAEIACECMTSGLAQEIIQKKRTELINRYSLLEKKLQGFEFAYKPASLFVWLKLPDFISSMDFEKIAGEHGVHVVSAEKFTVGSMVPPNFIRLSLCSVESIEELDLGLSVIQKILNREIGLTGGML